MDAYIDDIIVESRHQETLVEDLRETFDNLHKIDLKLNPPKCSLGVLFGKLLGLLVSHQGIEANPDKIKVVEAIQAPQRVKGLQRLNSCLMGSW